MSNPRVFQIPEAVQLIPALSPKLVKLQAKQKKMQAEHDQLLMLELMMGEAGIDYETEDGKEYLKRSEALETLILSFEDDIMEINKYGCVLKDIEAGRVDFFHVRERELVYLCWRVGEKQIFGWHDIDGDCDARKPI